MLELKKKDEVKPVLKKIKDHKVKKKKPKTVKKKVKHKIIPREEFHGTIKEYIAMERKKGYRDWKIKKRLLKAGWKWDIIEKYL